MEPTTTNKENSVGAIIASILVIALLIIAGLYFWGQKAVDNGAPVTAPTDEQTQADIQAAVASDESVSALKQTNTSDDAASIEADLNSTDLDNI